MIDCDSGDELQHFEVIAQAQGILSVRAAVTITEAAAILRAEAAACGQPVSKAAAAIVGPPLEQSP